jgi:hypothetical protein
MDVAELQAMTTDLGSETVRIRAQHVLKGPGYIELVPATRWSPVGFVSFDPDSTPKEVFIANLISCVDPKTDRSWYELQSPGSPDFIADRLRFIVSVDLANGWEDDPFDLLFCPTCGAERSGKNLP